MENTMKHYAGPTFEELTEEEMTVIQGSGDVQAETTPVCVAAATTAASSTAGWVAGGVATGITVVMSIKSC